MKKQLLLARGTGEGCTELGVCGMGFEASGELLQAENWHRYCSPSVTYPQIS